MSLRPFFRYYGGKWRAAPLYPQPQCDAIIEPFAGSAGYSLRHYERQVLLCDIDPVIYRLWKYLIGVPESRILSLPVDINCVDELTSHSDEEKWLIGFWLNSGSATPHKTRTKWMQGNNGWSINIRQRIADQLQFSRHWSIITGDFESCGDSVATWFIDPPYNNSAGRLYKHKFSDYTRLGNWCKSRRGQVIVCENDGATWLPFKPFANIQSAHGKNGKGISKEAIWTIAV